jgi:hypothetical protein
METRTRYAYRSYNIKDTARRRGAYVKRVKSMSRMKSVQSKPPPAATIALGLSALGVERDAREKREEGLGLGVWGLGLAIGSNEAKKQGGIGSKSRAKEGEGVRASQGVTRAQATYAGMV